MSKEFLTIIAVGSNLSKGSLSAQDIVIQSINSLSKRFQTPVQSSRFFETDAFPPGNGPKFVNAVASFLLHCNTNPVQILLELHQIEAEFGRERVTRWGPRTLDLDLICFGDLISPDLETYRTWRDLPPADQAEKTPSTLILPHPRIQDRAFVLVPLANLHPDWVHPVLGRTTLEMLADLPEQDRLGVKPLKTGDFNDRRLVNSGNRD